MLGQLGAGAHAAQYDLQGEAAERGGAPRPADGGAALRGEQHRVQHDHGQRLGRLVGPDLAAPLPFGDHHLDIGGWQRQVAVIYQDFTRYPLSAAQNVALPDLGGEIDQAALAAAARQSGADAVVAGLPSGWQTRLGSGYRDGVDLSGGQWQRIALARALYAVARGARVLVLDEPTAQLDIRAEAAFYDRFLELTAGVTTLVISHRFATVRRADRIAVLDGGRITELGSHAELVAAGGSYAGMFTLQAARFAAASPEAGRHG